MARRRYGRSLYSGMGQMTPPPITVVAPRIDVEGLQAAYGWMSLDRILGLRMATEWYSNNTAPLVFGKPLDTEQQKRYDKAQKCILLGNSGSTPGEKDASWAMAIRIFEVIWPKPEIPKLAEYANGNAQVPEAVAQISDLLGRLNKVFSSFPVRFAPTAGRDREVTLIPVATPAPHTEYEIRLPESDLRCLVTVPLLKTIQNEIPTVAKAISLVTVDGVQQLDGSAFFRNLSLVLDATTNWMLGNLRDPMVVKAIAPVQKTKTRKSAGVGTPAAPKIPRVPGVIIPSVDPWGVFRANTCKAAIAAKLHGGQFQSLADLRAICHDYSVTHGMINTAINDLKKKAKLTIKYDTTRTNVRVV